MTCVCQQDKNHELRIKQNEFDESRFDTVRPIRRTNKFSEVNSILVSWMRHIVKHWKIISQNTRKESNKRSVTNLWLHLCGINYHASKIIWHDWCDAMMSLNLRLVWKCIRLKSKWWRYKIVSFVFFVLICILMILVLALTVFSVLYRRAQELIQVSKIVLHKMFSICFGKLSSGWENWIHSDVIIFEKIKSKKNPKTNI